MLYNGKFLKPFTSSEPVTFNPPKDMLCWEADDYEPVIRTVYYYNPQLKEGAVFSAGDGAFRKSGITNDFCAEIPKEEHDIVSNRELSQWLSSNRGEVCIAYWDSDGTDCKVVVDTHWQYHPEKTDKPVEYVDRVEEEITCLGVREWGSNKWVKPTKGFIHRHDSMVQDCAVAKENDGGLMPDHYIILASPKQKIAVGPIKDKEKAIEYLVAVTDWKQTHPLFEIESVYSSTDWKDADSCLWNNDAIQNAFGLGFPKLTI